jgi:hypothetical protein
MMVALNMPEEAIQKADAILNEMRGCLEHNNEMLEKQTRPLFLDKIAQKYPGFVTGVRDFAVIHVLMEMHQHEEEVIVTSNENLGQYKRFRLNIA